MKLFKTVAVCLSALVMLGSALPCCAKKMTPWKKGAAETGKYRNYFKELGYSKKEINQKIADAYYEVFESDTRAYYEVEVDGVPMGYVSDVKTETFVLKDNHTV